MKPFYVFLLSFIIFESNVILGQKQGFELDAYGGIVVKPLQVQSKGYFQVTKHDGQWWFATPKNHAFLAFGLNHFHAYLWAQTYNKDYWECELGGTAWSPAWKDGFYHHVFAISELLGANSLGYHNEEGFLLDRPKKMPYIRHFVPIKFSLHMNPSVDDYIDVFDPEFVRICEQAADIQVKPYIKDTMLIGFAMADIPGHTELWANAVDLPTWAIAFRNLQGSTMGKQQYVATMKELYASVVEFNIVYETSFGSWEELQDTVNWRPLVDLHNGREITDNNVFNKKAMRRYYEVATSVFRKTDANHLFFGDKLNANLKDPKELELVIDVAKDYVDAICIQFYGKGDYQIKTQQRITQIAKDIPFFNGDGGFGAFGDPLMPSPQTPTAKNQAERALWFSAYAENAFANPNFIGWYICGVIDAWNVSGTQKAGIMNPLGHFHQEVIDTVNSLSERIYRFRGIGSYGLNHALFTDPNRLTDDDIGCRPNPTEGLLYIEGIEHNHCKNIQVFDFMGRLIDHKKSFVKGKCALEIMAEQGLFLVTIDSDIGQRAIRVIKR